MTQVRVGGEFQDWNYVRTIAGEGNGAVGGGFVAGDEIGGKAREFGGILDGYLELGFLDVALKLRGEFDDVVVQRSDFGAGGLVFVDAGETKFEKSAFYVVLRLSLIHI